MNALMLGITAAGRRHGGGAPAVPDAGTIAGLYHRYRAASIALSNGAAVSTFPDSKGTKDLAAGGYDNPTFISSGPNGKPALQFGTGTQSFVEGGDESESRPRSVALVFKVTEIASRNVFFGGFPGVSGSGQGSFKAYINDDGTLQIESGSIAVVGTSTVAITLNVWHLAVFSISDSNWSIYIDGVNRGGGSHSTYFAPGNNFCLAWDYQYSSPTGTPFRGQIAEVLDYQSFLSGSEETILHNYAVDQYGIA